MFSLTSVPSQASKEGVSTAVYIYRSTGMEVSNVPRLSVDNNILHHHNALRHVICECGRKSALTNKVTGHPSKNISKFLIKHVCPVPYRAPPRAVYSHPLFASRAAR